MPERGEQGAQAPVEIKVDDLHKAFAGRSVLIGVNLTVNRGDCIAIVGGSGCGKTVLLNHILGQLRPDRGHVWVADHSEPDAPLKDLTELNDIESGNIRVHWGVVFQRNALFSGTVLENIALGLRELKGLKPEAILPIAQRSLTAVALASDDEFLARNQEELSGGMAKRLAVARALSMDPLVIFYDEPTTGLDPVSSARIYDLIEKNHVEPAADGTPRTTLIITHDKDLLQRLQPRVIMLHEGRVFFDGPYAAFHDSDSPVIRPYFELMPSLHTRQAA